VLNPALELRTANDAFPVGRNLAARVSTHVVPRDNTAFGDAHKAPGLILTCVGAAISPQRARSQRMNSTRT
jgi:hypothetical protein